MQALYHKAKKLKRSVVSVAPLLAAALDELEHIAEVETQLECLQWGAADGADAAMEALREIEQEA